MQAFVAVAERGKIGVVAEELEISRRTLTARLNAYEALVGQALIDRSHRRVIGLTAAGTAMLPGARRFVAAAVAHGEEVAAVGDGRVGVVRIGVYPARTPLMDVFVRWLERVDPAWRVEVVVLRPWPLRQALAFGQLEGALTKGTVPNPHSLVMDPRPHRFETVQSLPVGPRPDELWVTWRTGWTGPHAQAFREVTGAAFRVLRRAQVVRRRQGAVSPVATGWHPAR